MRNRSGISVFFAVIFSLVLREVKGRFGKSRLSVVWFIVEPLLHIAGMMLFITILRGRQVSGFDYPVYLLVGIAPFLLFKNIVLKGMEAINANKALFVYRQIRPIDAVIARCIVETLLMGLVYFAILFLMKILLKYQIGIHDFIAWVGMIFVGVLFSFGMAMIFCVLIQLMPEFKTVVRLTFMPLYFLSGVIIPIWLVPQDLLRYMEWNPFLHIVDGIRRSVFEPYPLVDGVSTTYALKCAIISVFLGMALFFIRGRRLVSE